MENKTTCPVCGTPRQTEKERLTTGDRQFFDCPRCGRYELSRSLAKSLPNLLDNEEKKILLCYSIRKMQGGEDISALNIDTIKRILKNELPTLSDQINNIILWFGDNFLPGQYTTETDEELQIIMGAKTQDGVSFLLEHLANSGLIHILFPRVGLVDDDKEEKEEEEIPIRSFTLTFQGWDYYGKINRGLIMNKKAFMAMKFGDNDLDLIFQNYFKPAVKATGFELFRLDEEPRAGLIDDRLRVEIRTSRFLISDLTHENAGAYWEAGFAEGLGKPVIYTCEKSKFESQKTHFDTNHHLTIVWDKENLEEAANQLKATIRATLPDEAKLTDDEE
jgi:transposase-like protein